MLIGGDWHVVEIMRREEQRPQTLDEVRDLIVQALTPIMQQQRIDDFLRQARKTSNIQYFGTYAPGNGLNPRDLIRLAQYAQVPEEKVDLYKQVHPDSEFVDQARYILENMGKPGYRSPKSVEDLRAKSAS